MSAAEQFTDDERDALLRALVKVVGPEKLAKLARPQRSVLPQRPEPRPEDFELVDRVRRRKGIR
jgi:hypothetical protein